MDPTDCSQLPEWACASCFSLDLQWWSEPWSSPSVKSRSSFAAQNGNNVRSLVNNLPRSCEKFAALYSMADRPLAPDASPHIPDANAFPNCFIQKCLTLLNLIALVKTQVFKT